LLRALERLAYPAPRLFRTLDGDPVASQAGWHALFLSYVDGLAADYSLPGLQLLGATLGALHALPASPQLGRAWWHPAHAVPTALRWLDQAAGTVPTRWRMLYQTARRVLHKAAGTSVLPAALIHADVWPENAVRSSVDQVTLIDWECAGWGPAVLDVGDLLLSAHYDTATLTPNAARIAAVLAGYSQQRRLTAAEVEALPTAVAFSAAFHTALHFVRRIEERWDAADTTRRLARDEARLIAGRDIAAAARAWIEQWGPAWRPDRWRASGLVPPKAAEAMERELRQPGGRERD
jgi:Ser/Thr protein kinase RdoA (MazF antagonist)